MSLSEERKKELEALMGHNTAGTTKAKKARKSNVVLDSLKTLYDTANAFSHGFSQESLLGFSDELLYGGDTDRYNDAMKSLHDAHPIASTLGGAAGMIAGGGAFGRLGRAGTAIAKNPKAAASLLSRDAAKSIMDSGAYKNLGLAGKAGRAVGEGAVGGGIAGAGFAGEGERLKGAGLGAAFGGGLGGLAVGAGRIAPVSGLLHNKIKHGNLLRDYNKSKYDVRASRVINKDIDNMAPDFEDSGTAIDRRKRIETRLARSKKIRKAPTDPEFLPDNLKGIRTQEGLGAGLDLAEAMKLEENTLLEKTATSASDNVRGQTAAKYRIRNESPLYEQYRIARGLGDKSDRLSKSSLEERAKETLAESQALYDDTLGVHFEKPIPEELTEELQEVRETLKHWESGDGTPSSANVSKYLRNSKQENTTPKMIEEEKARLKAVKAPLIEEVKAHTERLKLLTSIQRGAKEGGFKTVFLDGADVPTRGLPSRIRGVENKLKKAKQRVSSFEEASSNISSLRELDDLKHALRREIADRTKRGETLGKNHGVVKLANKVDRMLNSIDEYAQASSMTRVGKAMKNLIGKPKEGEDSVLGTSGLAGKMFNSDVRTRDFKAQLAEELKDLKNPDEIGQVLDVFAGEAADKLHVMMGKIANGTLNPKHLTSPGLSAKMQLINGKNQAETDQFISFLRQHIEVRKAREALGNTKPAARDKSTFEKWLTATIPPLSYVVSGLVGLATSAAARAAAYLGHREYIQKSSQNLADRMLAQGLRREIPDTKALVAKRKELRKQVPLPTIAKHMLTVNPYLAGQELANE